MKTKGSLRRIPDKIEKAILESARKEKETPRKELAHKLRKRFGVESPSLQTLMKKISHARNPQSPLDGTWTVLTLKDHPLEPVAVQKILELKAKGELGWLSIREAQWISYLSALPLSAYMLYGHASQYSLAEEISESSKTDFDTTEIDTNLINTLQDPKKAMYDLRRGKPELFEKTKESLERINQIRTVKNESTKG